MLAIVCACWRLFAIVGDVAVVVIDFANVMVMIRRAVLSVLNVAGVIHWGCVCFSIEMLQPARCVSPSPFVVIAIPTAINAL